MIHLITTEKLPCKLVISENAQSEVFKRLRPGVDLSRRPKDVIVVKSRDEYTKCADILDIRDKLNIRIGLERGKAKSLELIPVGSPSIKALAKNVKLRKETNFDGYGETQTYTKDVKANDRIQENPILERNSNPNIIEENVKLNDSFKIKNDIEFGESIEDEYSKYKEFRVSGDFRIGEVKSKKEVSAVKVEPLKVSEIIEGNASKAMFYTQRDNDGFSTSMYLLKLFK